jgi:hypothetical protein
MYSFISKINTDAGNFSSRVKLYFMFLIIGIDDKS